MNNDDKILKTLDQHGKILTALVQNVATVLQNQREQGEKQDKQGKQISAVKEVVNLVDMKVEAGNNKLVSSVAELKEDMATKADVMDLGAKIDKVTKDHNTRIKELEEDRGIHHRDKN
jgi:hypothetical protein